MISRRFVTAILLALSALLTAAPALADSAFWEKIANIFGDSDRTVSGTIQAADGIRKTDYTRAERAKVIDELDQLRDDLVVLYVSNAGFANTLENYVEAAKQPNFTSRDKYWKRAIDDTATVLEAVKAVQQRLQQSEHLNARLDAATRGGLNQALLERSNLLGELQSMAAPSSPEDIAGLEKLADRYAVLRQRLDELRASLSGARRRLAEA